MAFGAFLQIREFKNLGFDRYSGQKVWPAPEEPGVNQAALAVSGGSAQSAAFSATTQVIELSALVDCYFEVGLNPTATTNSQPLAAGQTKFRTVAPGKGYKVAVLAA